MIVRAPAYSGPVSQVPIVSGVYTPTVTQTGNTFTGRAAYWYKIPGMLVVQGSFQAVSSVTAVSVYITLPSGFVWQFPLPGGPTTSLYGHMSLSSTTGTAVTHGLWADNTDQNRLIVFNPTLTAGAIYGFNALIYVGQ